MKIDYRTIAKNEPDRMGWTTVDSRWIFNFDAIAMEHSEDEKAFLATLTHEWQRVPGDLLDCTTDENFYVEVRLPVEVPEQRVDEGGKLIIDGFDDQEGSKITATKRLKAI